VTAAGALVWRRSPSGSVDLALIHRPRYNDWSFPKGKSRAGEPLLLAALREVTEETGYTVVLGVRLGATRYLVAAGEKVVHYWAAQPSGGQFYPSEEVDELRWVPLPQVAELLTHPHDRVLLGGLEVATASTGTVLLVRHPDAGERESWHGDQDLRPLTSRGLHQAQVLRRLLPAFGPRRVYSAPPLRCRQAVEGLATDLGVPVALEPLLSEQGYQRDPTAGLNRLIDIAAGPGPAVVCSQGGVIPGLLRTLAVKAGLRIPEVRSEKGSFWALFFGDGPLSPLVLLAADYYDDALR
jgi:8-oxo-dGTP diphosphatase